MDDMQYAAEIDAAGEAFREMEAQAEAELYAFEQQRAAEEFAESYAEWRSERLEDDPDLTDEDVDEESFADYLVSRYEDIYDI